MENESKTLSLTGVVIKDTASNGFTGYMLEIPEVIAEGNTEQEVQDALFENLKLVMEFKREDSASDINRDDNYSTTSFNFALA